MYERMNTVVIGKTGDEVNTVLVGDADTNFRKLVRESIKGYTDQKVTDKVMGTERHITMGTLITNLLALKEYENILFVPSFRNNRFPTMMDANYSMLKSNASQHMAPIINKYYDSTPNIYVAFPDGHSSVYQDLMLEFGVNIIESSGMYTMGDGSYTVTPPDGVVFDCVYLAGHDITEGESFVANDIKNDFSNVCTEGFDLIDDYQSDAVRYAVRRENPVPTLPDRLTGDKKNINNLFDYLGDTIRSDGYDNEQFKGSILNNIGPLLQKFIRIY
jgi:hypothetical protein|tara:strand:+ start:187 stop:1008 length:822 start_codon:yes stop_codon:yes gene_type:complete